MSNNLYIPCKCGCHRVNVLQTRFGILHWCLIGCNDILCDEHVVRVGLTELSAERRAKRAWRRRATHV